MQGKLSTHDSSNYKVSKIQIIKDQRGFFLGGGALSEYSFDFEAYLFDFSNFLEKT